MAKRELAGLAVPVVDLAVEDRDVEGGIEAREVAHAHKRKHAEAHIKRSRSSGGHGKGFMDVAGEEKL